MKRRQLVLLFLMVFGCCINTFAENSDIFISVVQPERSEIPQEAVKQLENKMHQLITGNGIADTDPHARFVITAKSNTLTKDIIGGAPQRISQKVAFTFTVGDLIENKVFDSYTFTSIGIGINENKAYINAISKMKISNPQFTDFIERAKQKIIQYYAVKCEQIIVEAKQQAANRDYQQAIYLLMQIPSICDCADKCQTLMIDYYEAYTEATAAELLNEAKVKWASAPNANGAAMAVDVIAKIPAGTKIQSELDALIAEINQKLREDEKRDWVFKMKQYEDEQARQKREFALRKQQQEADIVYRNRQQAADNEYRRREQVARDQRRRLLIDACRQVGLAFAKNYQPPTYNLKNVYAW
ncbi:MAG: hypothetical protein IJL54_05255 [Prevotella sp.]|nr:hypothetical protein [Prevotella sp.]